MNTQKSTATIFLETGIVFATALLIAVLYYTFLTYALAGQWVAHFKLNDIPDWLIFAVSTGGAYAAWRSASGRPRMYLMAGFAGAVLNLALVITANRLLSVFPASGAEILFIIVGIIGLIALPLIAFGFIGHLDSRREMS